MLPVSRDLIVSTVHLDATAGRHLHASIVRVAGLLSERPGEPCNQNNVDITSE